MKVFALVPAYNESARVGATVKALARIPGVVRVVVVDDGSTDGTAEEARAAGAEVVRLERNGGKGGAVARGREQLKDEEVVLLIDADLGETASEAEKLLVPLLEGRADMVVGDLPSARSSGGFGLVKRLANWIIRRRTGQMMAEPLSGQRAIAAGLFRSVRLHRGYGLEVGLTVEALSRGGRLLEVPVNMSHAHTGRDLAGFQHRGRQFRDVLAVVLSSGLRGGAKRGVKGWSSG